MEVILHRRNIKESVITSSYWDSIGVSTLSLISMLPIIDLHSILSLLLYSILNTNIIHATLSIDCQLFVDLAFQPNSTKSILGIVRLQPSPDPTAVDCAHVCLRSPLCRSAVFERQQMFCTLYNETATMSGRLLTNSTGTFTTIVTERSPGKISLTIHEMVIRTF